MKRVVALLLLAVFIVCSTIGVNACEQEEVTVLVKGKVFCFGERQLIVKNGRILVPLQSGIFEIFSAATEYDHIYREIVIRTETHLLTLYMNQPVILNKGEICYEPEVAPIYKDETVYVPLRAFMEALGQTVEYDGATNIAKIS